MTKKFYEQRKEHLIEDIARCTRACQYNDARVVCGRLYELIDIAFCVESIISSEQYQTDHGKVAEYFYDNL